MKKSRKLITFVFVFIIIASLFVINANAASYPLIIADEFETSVFEGDTTELKFTIFHEYTNEAYTIKLYNEYGDLCASVSDTMYNTNYSTNLTITVDTADLNLEPGRYTVKYQMSFYTFYEWHDAPNEYTGYLNVLDDVCNGNHKFDSGVITTEPTCSKAGEKLLTCTVCSYTKTASVPATHKWNSGKVTTASTCIKKGVKTYTCTGCSKTKTEAIPLKNHTYSNNADTNCNVCNKFAYPGGNTLYKENGNLYHVVNRKKVNDTTLVLYGGKYLYVRNGVYTKTTAFVNYNGKTFYVKNGALCKVTGLVNYGGKVYYVKNGIYTKATTLVKHGTYLMYVKNGVYTKATTLVSYGGKMLYVKNGVYTKATTLVSYGGKLLYVKNGVYTKATTLVKYGSRYYYVKNGVMNPAFSGRVKIGTKTYTVKRGIIV